jgi:hypothetical protein
MCPRVMHVVGILAIEDAPHPRGRQAREQP